MSLTARTTELKVFTITILFNNMNDSSSRRPVIVGLFVFIGLAILITGILMIGNLHGTFKRKMKIIALFDDVGGLHAGFDGTQDVAIGSVGADGGGVNVGSGPDGTA